MSDDATPVIASAELAARPAEQPTRKPTAHERAVAIENLLDQLPLDDLTMPDADVVQEILDLGACCETAILRRLAVGPDKTWTCHASLISFVGQWRSPRAVMVLLRHLGANRRYADDELIHALTRIGPPAITSLVFALFDRGGDSLARQRAARALGSIGLAACDYGHEDAWPGSPDDQYAQIGAALHLTLCRRAGEPAELTTEVAMRLAELRYEPARSEVLSALAGDTERLPIARQLMDGTTMSLALGMWRQSMWSWMGIDA